MLAEIEKENLLEALANFHLVHDDYQVIIDENDGVYILPALRGYFTENSKNQETIQRVNRIFEGYLQDQFSDYPLEFQEVLNMHLEALVNKAYQNIGWNKDKMLQRGEHITVGFLKTMLKELKELVEAIGRIPALEEQSNLFNSRGAFGDDISPFDYLDPEAKERVFSIFKNLKESIKPGEILSFNRELYVPEVLIAEYLSKLGNFYGFEDGECVKVPLAVEKKWTRKSKWKMIPYRVNILPLWKDVFAYGFLPEAEGAPQLLLFCGSGYSLSSGKTKIKSSVSYLKSKGRGYLAYKSAEKLIESWLQESFLLTQQKAIVLGYELGGALACYTTSHLYSFVQKGMTFNGVDVDEKTTRLWNDLKDDKDRPVLHNFYLEGEAYSQLSHQTIGENFDLLTNSAVVQLEKPSQTIFEQDVVLCRHRSEVRRSTIQKISSLVVPIVGDICFDVVLVWDWLGSHFSLSEK